MFESAAGGYERTAKELERAVEHLRVTARHYRERDVPRACTHAFAAHGHMTIAWKALNELAALHAAKARPEI